ncbi:MAG: helicase-associated domain-containing protein [Microbacterium sp.]
MAASDARTLAHELEARGDAALASLLAARQVSPDVPWADAFDAVDHLLEPASLARAIAALTAGEAHTLDVAIASGAAPVGAERDALIACALLDERGAPWESVAAAFRAAVPIAHENIPAAAPPVDDDAEAERAFTASASLADVLQEALSSPLGRIGTGTLGAVDRRRLIESGVVADAAAADDLVAIAERTGLLAVVERAWLVTSRGIAWLHSGTVTRWLDVATRLIAALPAAVRTPHGGWQDLTDWPAAYPFDPAWPARAAATATLLKRWAVVDASGTAPAWSQPAADGDGFDQAALAALLPPEVDRVFLQNDLSAIAPGSLAPQLDIRLRSMARRESRAQASTYRFTADTLADALTAGETAATLRAFLLELSLTGLPQPLAYEIERSASRHGALRVGPDRHGRTRVASDDEALLRTIAVDQALRPLGLVPDGDELVTRSSADTAFWMIADARYPVVAVDADGQRRALDRHRLAPDPVPDTEPAEVYAELIARLRSTQGADADAAWLARELEQAVRTRATLTVAVRMPGAPGDAEREFTIEATGLSGGRLRGVDKNVDVERTLPVASITRVDTA